MINIISWHNQLVLVALFSLLQRGFSYSPSETSLLTRTTNIELQKHAGMVASSFELTDNFNPLIPESHTQTIGGYLLRGLGAAYLPRNQPLPRLLSALARLGSAEQNGNFWDSREEIDTFDGDFFHVDYKFVKDEHAPMVVLCHGLESNSNSALSRELARAFNLKGMHCACINFRGCSGQPNKKLGGYHLGFTDDLKQFLGILKARHPERRNFITGFSLGANVVVKCLGELGESALSEYNIHGAAALCTPLCQRRNSAILAKEGINRRIYTKNLLKNLKKRAQEQLILHCNGNEATDKFDYKKAMEAEFIHEFDDAFIAKIYGFESCWDYYGKSSSLHYLDDVHVPCLILNAKDDSFMDPSVWPTEKSIEYGGHAPLKMIRTDSGGHLGYFFHLVDSEDERLLEHTPSWLSLEAARFLDHAAKKFPTQFSTMERNHLL